MDGNNENPITFKEPENNATPPEDNPLFEKSTKKRKTAITAVLAAVIVLIAGGITAALIFSADSNIAPARDVLMREMSERFDDTAFSGLRSFAETSKTGRVGAVVDYTGFFGDIYSVDASLSFDTNNKTFYLEGIVGINEDSLDIGAYLDSESIAVTSSVLENIFYGITFESSEQDIAAFAGNVGLPEEFAAQIESIADMLRTVTNTSGETEADAAALAPEFQSLLKDFTGQLTLTKESGEIVSGGENTRAVIYSYAVEAGSLSHFLRGFCDIMQQSDYLRGLYERYEETLSSGGDMRRMSGGDLFYPDTYDDFFNGYAGKTPDYDEFLLQLRAFASVLDTMVTGEVLFTTAVADGRIAQAGIVSNLFMYDEPLVFSASADFGRSVEDDWVFDINYFDEYGDECFITIIWEYSPGVNSVSVRFIDSYFGSDSAETSVLSSEWDAETGRFKLSSADGYGFEYSLSGVIRSADGGFEIDIDPNDTTAVYIWADKEAVPDKPEYINIDEWDMSLIEKIVLAADDILYYDTFPQ